MRILRDLSRPLSPQTPVWPGDTPVTFDLAWSQAAGASVNVGVLRFSTHAGTHLDAPWHVDANGARIEALPLDRLCGACLVLDVRGHARISRAALPLGLGTPPRLLLRTDAWPVGTPFPSEIPVLEPDVPAFLADAGVTLLGVDVPSVDSLESESLPVHHALFDAGVWILESLDLSGVAPGIYELAALPLRLVGADAAPVRALLLDLG